MPCRGVHFALTAEDEQRLRACPPDDRADFISNDIEEHYMSGSREWFCETDKAWDAIHRAFAPSEPTYEYRTPLHGAVLGGEPLYFRDNYIISLKKARQVRETASALANVTEDSFRRLYYAIDQAEYAQPLDDIDFDYSWSNLEDLVAFYHRAAEAGRSVIFTVSQ